MTLSAFKDYDISFHEDIFRENYDQFVIRSELTWNHKSDKVIKRALKKSYDFFKTHKILRSSFVLFWMGEKLNIDFVRPEMQFSRHSYQQHDDEISDLIMFISSR